MDEWDNHLEKNQIKVFEKNSNNECQNAACEQKKPREFFRSNTIFSLYSEIRVKNSRAKPLALSWRDKSHYSNLTSKIVKKMSEQLFQKRERPNTIQIV